MREVFLLFILLMLNITQSNACECYRSNESLVDSAYGDVVFERENLEFISKVNSHNPYRYMYSWCIINNEKYRVAKVEWGDKSYRRGISINEVNPGECGVKRTGGKDYVVRDVSVKYGRLRDDFLSTSDIETIFPAKMDVALREDSLENLLEDYTSLMSVLRETGRLDLSGELSVDLPISEEANRNIRRDNSEFNSENYFQVNIVYLSSLDYEEEDGVIRLRNMIFIEADEENIENIAGDYYVKITDEGGDSISEIEIPLEKLIYTYIISDDMIDGQNKVNISNASIQIHHVEHSIHAAFGSETYALDRK